MANLFADIIKPTPTVIEPVKPKRNIFDDLFEATTATEGLISGQTPLRITNPQMRQWKTIQGVPRDPNAVIPEDRQNFFFVKPEQVPDVIKSQWKNYFKTPEKFNLTPDSSLEDAIKTFDQQNPQNKIKFLQDKGIDIKQKLKSFDINKLNPLRVGTAEAAETNLFADLAPKQTNLFADIAQPKPSFAEILGFPTERYPNGVPPELKPNWLSALEAPIKGLASGVTDIPRKLARPSYKTPKQVAEYEGREEEVARFRKKHPVLTGAGEIVGSTAPYIAATTAGLPLPSAFGAVGGISQVAGQLSTPEEKLSVGQRLGKVGTATVAGVITGTIFKAAGAGKNILSRILQRAGGAGATAITENIVQDAMSGKEPDPLKALAIGGRQAAIIGIIGAMVEVPTLRNAILREGRSLAKKPVNFQEAVEIIKKTGRNPESLSPEFQNAILEGQKKLAMDNIKASAKRYGVPVDVMKQVIQANNAQEALAITDRYLYKMSKVNPELASKLILFRQQLSQGVHPADILIMQEVLDMAKPKATKATVEKVVEPHANSYVIVDIEGYLKENWKAAPLNLKNKNGLPPVKVERVYLRPSIIEPGLKVEPKIIQPKVEPSKFTGGKVTQPKVVKPTPVITQPLALEAKQYKTAEEVITDPARVQEIKNSIAEGEMILKSGKTIAGKKMSTGELEAVRKSVESAKAKITPPAKPPTAIAGEPEEENLKELEEFFASKAKEDVASKLSEEDIAKSQSEMKIITYESRESLFKAIKENGGIAPYAKGYLKENWKAAPLNLKNKNGLPPDEMADVLKNQGFHFEGDNDLLQAILQEQRLSKLEKIEYKEAKQYLRDLAKRIKDRTKVSDKLVKAIGRLLSKGTLTGPAVKKHIRLVTGQTKVAELVGEDIALREVLKKEQQISKMAASEGKRIATEEFKTHAKEVKARAKEREEISTETKQILSSIKNVDTSKMAPQFKNEIDNLKSQLDFTKPTKMTISSLQSTAQFIEQHPDRDMPDYILERVKRLYKLNRSDMTLDDLRAIHTQVMHFKHLNKRMNQIKVARSVRDHIKVVDESVSQMKPAKEVNQDIVEDTKGKLESAKKALNLIKETFGIRQEHYDLIVETLAGTDSIMYDVLMTQIKEGRLDELLVKQSVRDNWKKDLTETGFFKNHPELKDLFKWYEGKVKVGRFNLTRGQRMALYRHSLNEDNYRHLTEGGFAFASKPTQIYKISEDELSKIIGNLSEAEKTYSGNPVEKLFVNQGKQLNKVFYEKNGYEVKMLEDGTYYPIDVAKAGMPSKLEAESILDDLRGSFVRIGLSKGMLNERVNSKLPIILGDLHSDILKSVNRASAYIGLEIPLSNASKLLYDKTFKANMVQRYGESYWKEIERGLQDIAGRHQDYTALEKSLLGLKNQLSKAILGLNPFVIAKQPVSYFLYSIYVNPEYLIKAALISPNKFKEIISMHKEYSPEFWARVEEGFQRDVAEVFLGKPGKFFGQQKALTEKQLGGIIWADTETVGRGMYAAVLQRLDELKGSDMSLDEKMRSGYRFAEMATNQTQPSFAVEHRSGMSRGTPIEKLLTFAGTQTNQHLNILKRTWRKYQRTKDPKDLCNFIKAAILISVVSSSTIATINLIRDKILKRKTSTGQFVADVVGNNVAMVYIARDIYYSLNSKIRYGTYGGVDINVTATTYLNTMVDMMSNLVRLMQADTPEKRKKELTSFAENFALTTTRAAGLSIFGSPWSIYKGITKKPQEKSSSKFTSGFSSTTFSQPKFTGGFK